MSTFRDNFEPSFRPAWRDAGSARAPSDALPDGAILMDGDPLTLDGENITYNPEE